MTSESWKDLDKELAEVLLFVSGTVLAKLIIRRLMRLGMSSDIPLESEQDEYEEMLGI